MPGLGLDNRGRAFFLWDTDMPFTDQQFVTMALPQGVNFNINGISMSVATAVQNALDEQGSREMALSQLFQILESDHTQSQEMDQYSYKKWNMRGSDYWRIQANSSSVDANQPNVTIRPTTIRNWWGNW